MKPEAVGAIAVDAGGTSTRAVVVLPGGECVGYGRSGGANPNSTGSDAAVANVVQACCKAVDAAPTDEASIGVVFVTMAGAFRTADLFGLPAALRDAGLDVPVVFASDVLSAYFSGTAVPDGRVLVVGTGAVAALISEGQIARIRDGLGWLLGDVGSGFWLGLKAAQAAGADIDSRGPATALTADVMATLGANIASTATDPISQPAVVINASAQSQMNPQDPQVVALTQAVYRRRPIELAVLAPVILRHPTDPVAAAILDEAADGLITTLTALDAPDPDSPVVLAGGIARAPALADRLHQRLPGVALRPAHDGTAGAALLALRHLGLPHGAEQAERIRSCLAQLVGPGLAAP